MLGYYLRLAWLQPRAHAGDHAADDRGDRARHRRDHDHADGLPPHGDQPDRAQERGAARRDDRQLVGGASLERRAPGPRPPELAYRDVVAIAQGAPAARVVPMRKTRLTVEPGAGRPPFLSTRGSRAATSSRCSRCRSPTARAGTCAPTATRSRWWCCQGDQRQAIRRREQRRPHGAPRRARVPRARRARRLAADAEVLRPQQRRLRHGRGPLPAVRARRAPRPAARRQRQLLEDRADCGRHTTCSAPNASGTSCGRAADAGGGRALPGLARWLRRRAEEARPRSRASSQSPLQASMHGSRATRSSAATAAYCCSCRSRS